MDLACWTGLLHKIFTSPSVLVSGLCVLYHNFYCIFSSYLPSTKSGLRYIYSCSSTDMDWGMSRYMYFIEVIKGSGFMNSSRESDQREFLSEWKKKRFCTLKLQRELHRILGITVRWSNHIITCANDVFGCTFVFSVNCGPAANLHAPRYTSIFIKFGTRGNKVKSEYHIQDGGHPGAGIQNIFDE
jgi:hypothetical protein